MTLLKHSFQVFLILFLSSATFAAGLESTTGVTSNSGALLDSGTAGAVKNTRPADGAIATPSTDAATGMADTMQPTGITKKTSRARAKQVCAANDTTCQQDPTKPKTDPK